MKVIKWWVTICWPPDSEPLLFSSIYSSHHINTTVENNQTRSNTSISRPSSNFLQIHFFVCCKELWFNLRPSGATLRCKAWTLGLCVHGSRCVWFRIKQNKVTFGPWRPCGATSWGVRGCSLLSLPLDPWALRHSSTVSRLVADTEGRRSSGKKRQS